MLYMMAQHGFDLREGNELYLIKVGLSRNIRQRENSYKSDNPSALMIYSTAGTESEERACHNYLSKNGKHYSGEWYAVSHDFFEKCLKYGFWIFLCVMLSKIFIKGIDKQQNR